MKPNQKTLRNPCYQALDWLIHHSDFDKFEQITARTIQEHDLHGNYQEKVLADACDTCGMRAVCKYADKCDIGEIEQKPPAIPRHRSPGFEEIDTEKADSRN